MGDVFFYFSLLNIMGFCIAWYLAVVERKKRYNPAYKPLCDISEKISCTQPMSSQYSTVMDVPLSIWSMAYFFTMQVLHTHFLCITFILNSLALLGVFYCAYILYTKLRVVCIGCLGIHVIITMQWIFSLIALKLFLHF